MAREKWVKWSSYRNGFSAKILNSRSQFLRENLHGKYFYIFVTSVERPPPESAKKCRFGRWPLIISKRFTLCFTQHACVKQGVKVYQRHKEETKMTSTLANRFVHEPCSVLRYLRRGQGE